MQDKSAPRCANSRGHGNGRLVPMRAQRTCECGCGAEIPEFTATGTPRRFVRGHNARIRWAGLVDYLEVDCGYKTPCWVWQRNKTSGGYGLTWHAPEKCQRLAHRIYYERINGPIPSESQGLDHLCRNHACVNPDHLQPVSAATNTRRGANAKLTWDDVREIRASPEINRILGERYGVSAVAICNVKNHKRWREDLEREWS